MTRPSSFEDRLDAFLGEGPSTGPADLLATAHARARSVRQRPGWWLALKGDTMETTWRARPLDLRGLGYVLLIISVAAALAVGGLVVGSRLLQHDGRRAVTLPIPSGPGQLLAFTSWSPGPNGGDLYVVRADGTDGRHLTADPLDDFSPAWSPDGSAIAFYSGDEDSVRLRVISARGIVELADAPGCWNPTAQAPAWSPDGRFIAYTVARHPENGVCDSLMNDIYVVPTDHSAGGRRLLAESYSGYATYPAWNGNRIAFAGNSDGLGGLWAASIVDQSQPWDLEPVRIDDSQADPVGFPWTQWSPGAPELATTYVGKNGPYGNAVVMASDGASTRALWSDPTVDNILPAWSPDGRTLSLHVLVQLLSDHAAYRIAIVGADGSAPRILDTLPVSGNGGPASFSPDGALVAARAENGTAMPGAILIIPIDGSSLPVRIQAAQWSSTSWQPRVNPDNPAVMAPDGLPTAL